MKKYIIVGAGLSGSYIARNLAEMNRQVVIIEKRNEIGGNLFDYRDKGVLVQKYGPHIFHTDEDWVMEWLKRFSDFKDFTLRTQVWIEELGKFYNCPFDYSLLEDIYSKDKYFHLVSLLEIVSNNGQSITIPEMLKSEFEEIRDLGQKLWNWDYKLYTSKQWGIEPEKVDPEILKRVPFKLGFNTKVHNNKYECLPVDGYTKMFEKILNHPNIELKLQTDFKNILEIKDSKFYYENEEVYLIFTGAIDELFEYKFGELDYRSLTFEKEYDNKVEFTKAGSPCVDIYPSLDKKYTRITNYNKLPIQNDSKVRILVKEYPKKFIKNSEMERYYPINTEDDKIKFGKYLEESEKYDDLFLVGRLAEYKYYDMDKALISANEKLLEILSKTMNIYMVTGISGYIGSQFVERLLKSDSNAFVYGIIRNDSKKKLTNSNLEYRIYNNSLDSLKDSLIKSKYLVHLGAYYTPKDDEEDIVNLIESNITFSSLLFKGADKWNKNLSIISASTFSSLDEDGNYNPNSFYSATKTSVEMIAKYYKDLSIKFAVLPDTYGPQDCRNKIHNILNRNESWPFRFNNSENQKIALLHIWDVVDYLLKGLKISNKGVSFLDLYKIAPQITLKELSEYITDKECIFNSDSRIRRLTEDFDMKNSVIKLDSPQFSDLKKIKQVLNS